MAALSGEGLRVCIGVTRIGRGGGTLWPPGGGCEDREWFGAAWSLPEVCRWCTGACLRGGAFHCRGECWTRWPSGVSACRRLLGRAEGPASSPASACRRLEGRGSGASGSLSSSGMSTTSGSCGADCCRRGKGGLNLGGGLESGVRGGHALKFSSVASINLRSTTLAPAGGVVMSLSSGLSSYQTSSSLRLSQTSPSPRCKECFRSLPCFAVFRFGYTGRSHFTPFELTGPCAHPPSR